MKKFFLFIIPVLLFSCNRPQTGQETTETFAVTGSVSSIPEGSIVYVELDTLTANYLMTIDLAAEFEAKMNRYEADLGNRQRTFQNNVRDFENRATRGLETRARLAEIEQSLNIEQQNLMQLSENYRMEMAEEQAVMQRRILHAIMEYLKEYNKDKKHNYILGNAFDAKILYANPAFDITAEVLEGLNAKYRAEKR